MSELSKKRGLASRLDSGWCLWQKRDFSLEYRGASWRMEQGKGKEAPPTRKGKETLGRKGFCSCCCWGRKRLLL